MRHLTFSKGGIHPPQNKITPADRIIPVELPRRIVLPISQHIGAPAQPVVKRGDKVSRGQMVAAAAGAVSAPVHTSISGSVKSIEPSRVATGQYVTSIIIEADDNDHAADMTVLAEEPTPARISGLTPAQIVEIVRNAGIVGMGGATFPSPVKLTPPAGCRAEILIINGAECEPYLTCDDALMRAHARDIIGGIGLLMRAAGVDKAVVGIEDNKPEAIAAMTDAARPNPAITVQPLKTRYPQGGEKQLVEAITGRQIPSGALPIQVGAIVHNVATANAVYRAAAFSEPLIQRVVTVAGVGNYLVPIGMAISGLPVPQHVGAVDVVVGGPMMGRSAVTLDAPVTKGMSGVVMLAPLAFDPQPCIRCGACVSACPMGLEPYLLASLSRFAKYEEAERSGVKDCMECGSCAYSCPSGRPIVDYIRLAKLKLRKK